MKEFFDDYINGIFGERVQAEYKLKQFENNYRPFFPPNREAMVLDIGIGRGEMLSCMKNWGYENYRGIDISRDTVRFCTSLGLRCERTEDVGSWLEGKQGEFDLISLLDVLEHVKKEDVILFLKRLKGSLNKGGILIIQVPNMQAPASYLHRYNDFTHEAGYSESSLRQILLTAGFTDITMNGFEESVSGSLREKIRLLIRPVFWKMVRLSRRINGNLNPSILFPVFYAVVRNSRQGAET